MEVNDLITVKSAAKLKKVTRQAVYWAIKAGTLPAIEIDGVMFIRKVFVDGWTPRRKN